jgi:phage shock protein PspC (stress-responsive transcriptional regulator)
MSEQTTTSAPPPDPPPRKRLERTPDDRMVFGIAGGIAKYLGIDSTVVRIAIVGLTILGGAGALLYIAALLLMPEPGGEAPIARGEGRGRAVAVAGLILLGLIAFAVLAAIGSVIGWLLIPAAFLVVAGVLAWWIASGERPAGTPGEILKRAALGIAILIICFALALGGAYAAGTGSGALAAGLVIGAGIVLVAAAFARPARWLILPALSLALSAGFVSAAGIDLDGGVGDREYRPTSAAEIREEYKLGVGELIVDLRNADLPPGDHKLNIDLGVGHALLLVPRDVCVATVGEVGVGAIEVFGSENGGIDVGFDDARTATAGNPRIVLDGDVGMGFLEVNHRRIDHRDDRWDGHGRVDASGNEACVGGAARAGAGLGPVG